MKNFFSCLIVVVLLLVCFSNCTSKKTDTQPVNFECVNGDVKVVLKILTGNDYLVVNDSTKTVFMLTNVKRKSVMVSGRTIRTYEDGEDKDNEVKILMSPEKKDLENGFLKINLSYRVDGEYNSCSFNVPVR